MSDPSATPRVETPESNVHALAQIIRFVERFVITTVPTADDELAAHIIDEWAIRYGAGLMTAADLQYLLNDVRAAAVREERERLAKVINERLHHLVAPDEKPCATACTHQPGSEWTLLGLANVAGRAGNETDHAL